MTYEIDISQQMPSFDVDLNALRQAVVQSLHIESIAEAVLSVSLVDNVTIHELNRHHLQHDYPTDVISFQLDWTHPECDTPGCGAKNRSIGAHIEGEIIVNVEYAQSEAEELGWELQSELTLYVIHGMLHVCGYDDRDRGENNIMRARETAVFDQLGLSPVRRHADSSVPFGDYGQENSE